MRILISAVLYGRGGTETHLLHLCRYLRERDHDIILACRYSDRSVPLVQQAARIGIKRLKTPFDREHRTYRLSTLFAMVLWPVYLVRHKADLIITLETSHFVLYLSRFLKPGGKVLQLRAGLPLMRKMPEDIAQRIDGIVVETEIQAEAVKKIYPDMPVQISPLLGNIAQDIEPRRAVNRNSKLIKLAYLGRLDHKKGIFRLLDLWPTIRDTGLQLRFCGYGAEKQVLIDAIQQRGWDDEITVCNGWTNADELADLLADTDLLVLPSEEEGLPIILMESMAHGVPFVATDVGAVITYGLENPDVRIVPLNTELLASAIGEMVQAIRTGGIDGQRLQRYYRERYGYEVLVERWIEIVEAFKQWTQFR